MICLEEKHSYVILSLVFYYNTIASSTEKPLVSLPDNRLWKLKSQSPYNKKRSKVHNSLQYINF